MLYLVCFWIILIFILYRLTANKPIYQVQQEGRQLLLKSRQSDLQNAIEETTAEIRRKNHDKFKFHG